MMEDDSDATLVGSALLGNRRAFERLLERYLPMLAKLCRRALNDALLAEEAVQEASLRAFLNLDRLRQPDQFGYWLHGIGLNVCRHMLRIRSRDLWSWEALVGGSYVQEPVDSTPGPAELAENADLRERIRYAVTALPPGQRAAVMLFYLSGLSYAETAALLGIGVGAVRTRLHKARAALQQSLWSVWQEDTMATDTTEEMVEMRVADVWQPPAAEGKPRPMIVVLEEVEGERRFPIWVGPPEGIALASTLEQVETPRPMTYAFVASLLEASGTRLHEVRITRLADNIFFAETVVDGPAGRTTVDARPSDALNLAALMGAPIRVAAPVLEQAWRPHMAWDDMRREMEGRGIQPEHLPSQEQFEAIRKVIAGETTGGAAAIVAALTG